MGSRGENQAFGQSSNGYNASEWDNFNVSSKLDTVENSINNAERLLTGNYNPFNNALRKAQKQLDNATNYFNRNPSPDIMSKNQVQEHDELEKRISELGERIRQTRKKFKPK